MILSICDTPKVLEVMNIINIIITIIRIVVPIILLFSLIFKLVNASTKGNEDAIASIKKKAVPSIIAAALIFIVPVLVNLIIGISFPNSDYSKCLIGISSKKIETIYTDKAEQLVSKAEETLNINDYVNSKNYLTNIKDNSKRESYETRLEKVKEQIDNIRAERLIANYDKVNYSNFKWKFYAKNTGPISDYCDNCRPYAIWAPENVEDLNGVSLPLIVWFHGAGEDGIKGISSNSFLNSGLLRVMSHWNEYNLKPVPAIIVAAQSYDGWAGKKENINTINALVEHTYKYYNIDKNMIVFMGHSNGGAGAIKVAWDVKNTIPIYKIVGMSTNLTKYKSDDGGQSYYSNIPIRGYGEYYSFQYFFKWIGQSENFTFYDGESHNNVPKRAMTEDKDNNGISDLVEWMFYEE